MPAINANIVVEQTTLTLSPTTTQIGVTVDPINLGIYTTSPTPIGGSIGQLQYNVNGAQFGGVANTSVANGNITFTNLSNVKIDGGTNAYYLQTDGTGNLTWAAGGTPTGSGVPSGANTQIQLSDGSGSFASGAGFTFDNASNVFTVPGDSIATGNVTGGNLTTAGLVLATGNLSGGNITTGAKVVAVGNIDTSAGIFNGDGGGLSNIAAANVVGSLGTSNIVNGTSNVDIATADADVIVSVNGTSNVASFFTGGANVNGDLNVVSDITSTSGMITGDGGGLSNIAAANITGLSLSQIANGTSNVDIATVNGNIDLAVGSAPVARFSTTGAAYPAVFTVQGNINAYNNITAEPGAQFIGDGSQLSGVVALTANTVRNNAQPNITTVGTLTSLSLSSNNVTLGNSSIPSANAIALGYNAFGAYSAVSIGYGAGAYSANTSNLATYSVAIGHLAGYGNTRGNASIAIGMGAGVNQGANSIAIGTKAGEGIVAGNVTGANAIAIGHKAGVVQLYNNSIVINATGANLDSGGPNTLYIKPISGTSALTTSPLVYDSTTGLVTKEDELRVTNLSSDDFIVPTSNGSASLGYTGQRFSDLFVNNVVITNTIKANIAPTTAVSTTISHKIPIEIDGTTYYICLDSNL